MSSQSFLENLDRIRERANRLFDQADGITTGFERGAGRKVVRDGTEE